MRLSEGGLRRVKGEFGASEDGLLARRRRQRRLIHPGSCDGSSHGRSCGDHRPEGVQCGHWLGGNGGHGRDCGHARHTREGRHCTGCWIGVLELRVLLQLLVVLCIVPRRGGKGGVHGNTREDYVENGTDAVGSGYRNMIKGDTGTELQEREREQATGAFPLKPTRLGLARVSTGVAIARETTASWAQSPSRRKDRPSGRTGVSRGFGQY